jgi:hypothetical protein
MPHMIRAVRLSKRLAGMKALDSGLKHAVDRSTLRICTKALSRRAGFCCLATEQP